MAPRDIGVGSNECVLSRGESSVAVDAPRLTVVTVSWQTGPHLVEAVESILAAPGVDEFVLVNHGNPPEMTRRLQELAASSDKFQLVESGGNLGFAKGCNIGARRSSGDLVFFLNPDAVLAPGVASRLKASATDLGEGAWIIGARLSNPDGSEQRGGRRGELTPRSAVVSFLGLDRFLPFLKNLHFERDPEPDGLVPVPVVSGAALMMPRRFFLQIGGFDERYFLHVEDIDLCRKVRESGGSVHYEPRANIRHYGATSQTSPFFVETHKAKGFVKYFWKYYPGPVERLTTMLLILPIFAAIWGRAALGQMRHHLRRLNHRRRVLGRVRRLARHRGSRASLIGSADAVSSPAASETRPL